MKRIIPDWDILNDLKQSLTDGEKHLIRFLDENLQKDVKFQHDNDKPNNENLSNYNGWLIFVQPFLNGSRPDIVIFNPFVGCQIIEVKDWYLHNYSCEKDNMNNYDFYVSDNRGKYKIKSPVKQVEYYKEKLSGQLIPQLGEEFDKDKRKYGLIKTSLYFHNASTYEAQQLLEHKKLNYKVFPVFGKDILSPSNIRQIVPDSCYLTGSYYWNKEWNKEILFWLNPPFHSLEQTIRLNLNKYQKKFSEPTIGHHRVRGVAGSGKTQVLAYRAGKLASKGMRVLILSFNITLWHYIRDMVQRSPFEFSWKQFTFGHFHGFCKDILNEFGEKWPKSGEDESIFREIVPNKVLEVIKRGHYEKYDAIYIDEGQDYHIEWYNMLKAFLTQRDEVVVVCDKKQNIYGRNMDWLDKRRLGVEKFGDWIELKTVVRMPEGVAKITKRFSEEFNLSQDVRIENVQRPDLFNQYVEHTIWENINESDWLLKIDEYYEIIKENATSNHVSDTVILLPNKNYGMECVNYFITNKNLQVNHVFEYENESRFHRHKKAFWMGDSRLKMSTIHSFKGWEVLNVLMFIPSDYYGSTELFDKQIYVAMTRTRQNLIVINANKRYREFGEKLQKQWN